MGDERVVRFLDHLPPDLVLELEEKRVRQDAEKRAAQDLDEKFKRAIVRLAEAPPAPVPLDESKLAAEGLALLARWEAKGGKCSHLYNSTIQNPAKPGSTLIGKTPLRELRNGELSWGSTPGRRLLEYLKKNT